MPEIEIRVKGNIDQSWSDWFEGLTICRASTGETLLSGQLADKSAVYGVLSRLSSLGLTLISVQSQENNEEDQV